MWHPKPECGITQPSSRFDFYNVMTSSSSSNISPSTTISLVALVRHWEKWAKQSSNQAINQHFDCMTTTAQRAAVVKSIESYWSVGKSGQSKQTIKIFDSMTTTAERAAVMRMEMTFTRLIHNVILRNFSA